MKPPAKVSGPPVPIQEAVGEFVATLVDRGAAASKVTPTRLLPPSQIDSESDDPQGRHLLSSYLDQSGTIAALAIADLAFASATSAAFGMVPASAAADAVARHDLPDTLLENYREVANIMSSLLNSPTSPHVKVADTWWSDDDATPDQVWDLVAAPGKRREWAVSIEGYGSGRLGVIIR